MPSLPARKTIDLLYSVLLCLGLFGMAFALTACRGVEHYRLRGKVVATDPSKSEVTIDHKAIPNFMPAMTMPYRVKDARTLQELQPGDSVAAQLVVPADGSGAWLEDIVITDERGRQPAAQQPEAIFLQPGEKVPDVPMVNQDGKPIVLSDFRGKAVLIAFIYTRCPLPDYCPRISGQLASLQRQLARTPQDYRKTHLISVTLDPAYDTPPVLRKYGLGYMDDASGFQHWDFAAATPGNLMKLAQAFGLDYLAQDRQIVHSLVTVLITPSGLLASRWDGNQWKVADVLKAIKSAAHT